MDLPATRSFRCRGAAFTLVELLVTIAIIVVLAALAITMFRRARSAADRAVATRNLSQLQLANTSYAGDHNGQYVPVYAYDAEGQNRPSWYNNAAFLSYLRGDEAVYLPDGKLNLKVPPDMLDPVVTRARKRLYDTLMASFGYNHEGVAGNGWAQPGTERCFRVSQIVAPDRSCAFISCTDWIAKYSGRFLWTDGAAVEGKTGDGKIAFRHGGKALVVYYDGHMGEVSREDLEKIDQQGGVKHPFWDGDAQ